MDNKTISLQEKIQKLIDQYTKDKKQLVKLEEQNAELTEQNKQLMAQIESFMRPKWISHENQELENKLKDLEHRYPTCKALSVALRRWPPRQSTRSTAFSLIWISK